MPDIPSQIKDLKADFQRIADRAPWVRAAFSVRAGKIGIFMVGRGDGDEFDSPLTQSHGDIALVSELYVLTDQAGDLALETLQLRGNDKFSAPRQLWLTLLLHTPPICLQCWARGPDGLKQIAACEVGDRETTVWIENYAQTCVSALTWLKSKVGAEVEVKNPTGEAGHRSDRPDDQHVPPAKYLVNWREILDAVGLPFNDENKKRVRKLNVDYSGPIKLPERGGQPKVSKGTLLAWWNGLEQRFHELEQRDADTSKTLQEQHKFGAAGTVLPGIAGHVKKRRGNHRR